MEKTVGKVYVTDDFNKFKELDGNREVTNVRKQMLMKSIDKNGYITNPIVVNEKFQVIDGQGRLEACKELGVPIAYTIVDGIGINECMVLNQNMKNWTVKEFVDTYANLGNINYIRLRSLLNASTCGIRVVMFAVNGTHYGAAGDMIKSGRLEVTEEQYANAINALGFLEGFVPYVEKIEGTSALLEDAILYAWANESCDNDTLRQKFYKYYSLADGVCTFKQALDTVSMIYNRNCKKGDNRIYLREDWDRKTYGKQ